MYFLTPQMCHGLGVVVSTIFPCIAAAAAQSNIFFVSIDESLLQPVAEENIIKTIFYSLFIIEGSFILALVASFIIIFGVNPNSLTMPMAVAELASAFAVGLASIGVSIAIAQAGKAAVEGVRDQPMYTSRIHLFMLIMITLVETPLIFSFIVSLMVIKSLTPEMTSFEGFKMAASSLAMGIGALGSGLGQSFFTRKACRAISYDKNGYNKTLSFSLICQALLETPSVFCFLIAMLLFNRSVSPSLLYFHEGWLFLIAALCVSIGSIGPSIGIGMVGGAGIDDAAGDPKRYNRVLATTFLYQVVIETSCIFALIVSLFILMEITI